MAITEQNRHDLHVRLADVVGEQEATTLMEHLPPVGWADVATKTDLRSLEHELQAEFHRSFGEFKDSMHRDLVAFQRQLIFAVLAVAIACVVSIATSL